jgi:methylmalonyl-CoA epimerase
MQHLEGRVLAPGEFAGVLERIANRDIDPYRAASGLLERAVAGGPPAARLDHLGIAVRDAAAHAALFAEWFGLPTTDPEDIGLHRLRFVETGEATLELVEPLAPEAPVAKFLETRGAGLHHLCLRVPDLAAAMAALRAKGVRFIDAEPRPGAHGSRIAFIHPSSALGLLVELKEART